MTDFFNHLLQEFKFPLVNPVLIFSLILFIILLSPIILRKIRIPSIIGLIISGVVIGPHGLNILAKNSAIDLFSTIGLLYIMFIAGLELDLNDFKSNRNKSFLFGFLTFIIPITIGFPVCYYGLKYDFNASLLTASMFATHTLVAYPIVSKLGISKNQAVAIAVGGTILTDTAVLIILAIIMGSSEGQLNQEFWIRLGVSLVIFSVFMFIAIPRIAKWFFKKLESEKHSHYIFVLSVLFFSAFLAEVAGVEPIVGAFVAGLALNKLIPHSSALMNRIEFIGNSLFIPFFLISVGMIVNINVILSGYEAGIIALTLSTVAIFSKWIAAFFSQIAFKYSAAQRQLIFGLSSAHAAATLAVILVGYKAQILDENILNGTIILILITCIVASFATEKASKKIILEIQDDNQVLKTINTNEEHLLLPTANIENIEKLLEFSILIKAKKSAHPISILTVVSNNEETEVNLIKAKTTLQEFVKQGSASETIVNAITTIDHNEASGIVRISREIMANIIILGWPIRSGILDKLFGEKIEMILNNTDKTVMMCFFNKPIVLNRRIFVIIPPMAEREKGFDLWLLKTSKLAQELSISIYFNCNKITENYIHNNLKRHKTSVSCIIDYFEDWDDFFVISKRIKETDLIVMVSARKGTVSHFSILDELPAKLEKHYSNNSKIVIYPQQNNNEFWSDNYEDISAEPLSKGIETLQKIGKGIGNIFKSN